MITLAKADRRVVVSEGELDADPHLLNCLNGTIDLRTGKLREHRREDLITKLAPVEYDPTARAPRWQAFLSRTVADDLELVAFMQRVVGYVLAGGNPEHVFLIFYGLGANGKSVFVNAIRQMLGDYASTVATETFMQSRNANLSQSADLATLPGVRLVAMSETGEGRGLAEGLVKSVTGGEPVRCRHLYGAPFEYAPLFTPWLSTNHKPRIRGTDDGIWRRLVLAPFSVSIPKSEQDPELGAKLLHERAGIFAWAVEGYRQWREQGLNQPETVTDATREYRGEEDTVAQFVDECCERDPDARTENGALHTAYQSWCERNGFKPFSTQKFKPRLEGLGFEQKRGTQRFWPGLHLIPQVESDRRYA